MTGRHLDFAKHPAQDRAVHRDDTVTITGAEYLQTQHRLICYRIALERILNTKCDPKVVAEAVIQRARSDQ